MKSYSSGLAGRFTVGVVCHFVGAGSEAEIDRTRMELSAGLLKDRHLVVLVVQTLPLKDLGILHILGRGATSPKGGGVPYSTNTELGRVLTSCTLSPGLETAHRNIERLMEETLALRTRMGQLEDACLTSVVDLPP